MENEFLAAIGITEVSREGSKWIITRASGRKIAIQDRSDDMYGGGKALLEALLRDAPTERACIGRAVNRQIEEDIAARREDENIRDW